MNKVALVCSLFAAQIMLFAPPASASYKNSCKDIKVTFPGGGAIAISAKCRTKDGRWVDANYRGVCKAPSAVHNLDGKLVCQR